MDTWADRQIDNWSSGEQVKCFGNTDISLVSSYIGHDKNIKLLSDCFKVWSNKVIIEVNIIISTTCTLG